MAEKRMFSNLIVDSDKFLDMPLSAQALYFHMGMSADDDGFVNNPKKIQRTIGASEDDLKLLVAKQYLITFDSGVVVIKDWRIHNYIRQDRKKASNYVDELSQLVLTDTKTYEIAKDIPSEIPCDSRDYNQLTGKCQADVRQMTGRCQANVRQLPAPDKIRLEENRLDKTTTTSNNIYNISNAPQDDDVVVDVKKCISFFESIKGMPVTEFELKCIVDEVQIYSAQWVLDALEIMGKAGKVKISYCEGILANWKVNGRNYKPAKQAEAEKIDAERKKALEDWQKEWEAEHNESD